MIELDNDFYIERDSQCWQLVEKVSPAKTREGEPKFNDDGSPAWNTETSFHPTLGTALSWYVNQCLRGSESIKDALRLLNEAEARIEKIQETK